MIILRKKLFMIDILYQDRDILVCIKPSGTLSESCEDSHSLPKMIEEQSAALGAPISLFAVHRLDREVFGVMVFAKNREAAAKLSALVSERRFHKEYLAVVEGVPEKGSDTLKDLLFRDTKKNKTYTVDRKRAGVKEASLEYTTLGSRDGRSLAKIILHTGRTHQIRVQFASRGHSVAGDRKYGSSLKAASGAIALCSHKIEFSHPTTKKTLSFSYTPNPEYPWDGYETLL